MLHGRTHREIRIGDEFQALVVLSAGADMEMASTIAEKQIAGLLSLPAARFQEMLREFVIIKVLPKEEGRSSGILMVRGVPENVYAFRKQFRLLAGRLPIAGRKEVLAGRSASQRLAGMGVGGHLEIAPHQIVEIVGIFQCADSSFDSELWGDLDAIRGFFGRDGVTSSLRIRMHPADMPALIREARQRGFPLSPRPRRMPRSGVFCQCPPRRARAPLAHDPSVRRP